MKKMILSIFLTVFLIWLGWAAQKTIIEFLGFHWEPAKLAAWATTFASLNALFAALGFGGVILTIISQQNQIKSSSRRQHLEQFDKVFFQMLDLLNKKRAEIQFAHSKQYSLRFNLAKRELQEGPRAFTIMWREVYARARGQNLSREQIADIYESFVHQRYEWSLGPYFRLVYTMLKRIHQDDILGSKEKIMYGNLLRGQLTSYEIAVLGLNGLSQVAKDLEFYLAEYNFFKYLPQPGAREAILRPFYPEKSFKGRDEDSPALFFRRRPNAH